MLNFYIIGLTEILINCYFYCLKLYKAKYNNKNGFICSYSFINIDLSVHNINNGIPIQMINSH